MTTIGEHLMMNESEAYCPCCGDSKPLYADYCIACASEGEAIDLNGAAWAVGYVCEVITWSP